MVRDETAENEAQCMQRPLDLFKGNKENSNEIVVVVANRRT